MARFQRSHSTRIKANPLTLKWASLAYKFNRKIRTKPFLDKERLLDHSANATYRYLHLGKKTARTLIISLIRVMGEFSFKNIIHESHEGKYERMARWYEPIPIWKQKKKLLKYYYSLHKGGFSAIKSIRRFQDFQKPRSPWDHGGRGNGNIQRSKNNKIFGAADMVNLRKDLECLKKRRFKVWKGLCILLKENPTLLRILEKYFNDDLENQSQGMLMASEARLYCTLAFITSKPKLIKNSLKLSSSCKKALLSKIWLLLRLSVAC